MRLYPTIAIDDLPWLMIAMWSVLGLFTGAITAIWLWRNSQCGSVATVLYTAIGCASGGFLGLVYYTLAAILMKTNGS